MKMWSSFRLVPAALLLLTACVHQPISLPRTPVTAAPPPATGYLARDDVRQFIVDVAGRQSLEKSWLEQAFAGAHRRQPILDAIAKPYEAKPWYQYEPLFLSEARIAGGLDFWNAHAELLAKAETQYGVPARIIVAILGVETFYGRQRGGYPVMDALTTLGFDYPPRAPFFRSELEQYLLMCHEQSFDPLTLMGSYAGAMGAPQFMPDSFRQYAVDFDGDGKRDLWNDWADIIGSVANYFQQHGWQGDGVLAVPAALAAGAQPPATLQVSTVGALRQAGVMLTQGLDDGAEAMLVALEEEHETRYWVVLHNFRVITQYNKSPLYAMAIVELADAVADRRTAELHVAPP
jgi:membrane-bound lytic murein transglycosylase B